ncbi:MAG TPA: preprotein translocase subunit SecE [Candidatus Paceibacterota bacterium]|nr:preprotein translocase subunit SecE [Candidatus Paceibacterota bacterium]
MGALLQYLKDTRAELRHVAWPTQTQTIVYTLLVAGISLGLAAYLGLFDFLFTTGLAQVINNLPAATPSVQTVPVTPTTPSVPTTQSSTTPTPLTLPFTSKTSTK